MHIIRAGYNYRHIGEFSINRPHGSGDYAMVMAMTPAFFVINGREITVEPESIIVFRPDTATYYHGTQDIFIDNWFHFDGVDDSYFEALGIPPDTVITGFPMNSLAEIILKITNELVAGLELSDEVNGLYGDIFFRLLSRMIRGGASSAVSDLTEVRAAIYNMPYRKWDIDTLANLAGYSRSYFSHRYKEDFGTSPMQDVIESKMAYAKYLLENTDSRINEISEKCGFEHPVYFISTFKKKHGCTPARYRRNNSAD